MKRLLLLLMATFLFFADVKAQDPDTLVIEFTAKVKNQFSIAGLLSLRGQDQTDFDEDGVPELVLFERDDLGNLVGVVALDGRTHTTKWEVDLTNIQGTGGSLNKMSTGFSYTHRDSLIWRGFRRIRRIGGIGKSTGSGINGDRLAVMSGRLGGVLAINPTDNKALLNLDDRFRLLAIFDIDADDEEELIIVNKQTRRVFIVGSGKTE